MSKHRQDKITGFGALIFGLVMLKGIIPHYVVTSDRLNLTSPDTFPNFASWGLIILGVALLIKTYLEEYQSRDRTQPERREKTAGQFALTICIAAPNIDSVFHQKANSSQIKLPLNDRKI